MGGPSEYLPPDSQQELIRYILDIFQTPYGEEFIRYINEDGSAVRISGRIKDLKLQDSYNFEKKLQLNLSEKGYDLRFDCILTGESFLLDKVPKYLLNNLAYGLLFTFLIMGLIGNYMLGKIKYLPLALLPNINPLIIVAGLLGILQIYLKTDTAILFTIAFGMSVDNTIHFLHRFRIEKQSQNWNRSVQKNFPQILRSISLTTFLL